MDPNSAIPTDASETSDLNTSTILAQFRSFEGNDAGPVLNLSAGFTSDQLSIVLNKLLDNEAAVPYAFYIDQVELTGTGSLHQFFEQQNKEKEKQTEKGKSKNKVDSTNVSEQLVVIQYRPQALYRVKPVTRCSSDLVGHTEAVLMVQFSPDGSMLASCSGDTTVRFWDLHTETPLFTCKGHTNWVLCIAWSPDGSILASGSMDNTVRLWNPKTGMQIGRPLVGHKKWITSLAWEPYHLTNHGGVARNRKLASSSKDGTVRVWDTNKQQCLYSIGGHTASVTSVLFMGTLPPQQHTSSESNNGGNKSGVESILVTGSQDKTIKLWNSANGKLIKTLAGHAHWVNTLAISSGYVLRTGPYDPAPPADSDDKENIELNVALKKFNDITFNNKLPERLVSGSDDFTMFLWNPLNDKKPTARLLGHQKLVNHVCFSPDASYIASASFDNTIKLWDGHTGKYLCSLFGHVAPVYQLAWSSDSRLLLSCSRDSTLKTWDVATRTLKGDLPGHRDEVYTVDWSPYGDKVASGGKDKVLKIWKN
ncbi:Notchless protein-like protein [Zancudomyces culisetae]|uniref:Notchless protein-like protein n=1 Tax=Zancudomyces culisetae TaxID=1213189 RepID=A0A1R1PJ98_ZANCU|nr:Notchless protein-like protein [Zancudomyces culisetae]|eukprot:OMH81050.1 Notchless protein-like protein [Zancudomyces culisetae]